MRLISFDVGIKNLAYCVFSISSSSQLQTWSIPEWNCANLLEFDNPEPIVIKPCCHLIKGKRKSDADHPCNKASKWIVPGNPERTYCEMHAKVNGEWIIPKKVHTASHINKLKLPELEKEYSNTIQQPLSSTKKMKKSELIERITTYYESKCYRSVNENAQKTKTAGEIDLVTIGRAIRRQLDGDPSIEGITHVIIENQISTIAARMKTIQGMIAQYFIMRFGDMVHIEFVSSHNKLKGFSTQTSGEDNAVAGKDVSGKAVAGKAVAGKAVAGKEEANGKGEKTSYKANKADGIIICRKFIESNPEMRGWAAIFEKSKKRDDLADCFLQGIWYLRSNKIINYADNLKINSVIVS